MWFLYFSCLKSRRGCHFGFLSFFRLKQQVRHYLNISAGTICCWSSFSSHDTISQRFLNHSIIDLINDLYFSTLDVSWMNRKQSIQKSVSTELQQSYSFVLNDFSRNFSSPSFRVNISLVTKN